MDRKLTDAISAEWVAAANKLQGKKQRRRIVAYVESYDDVYFWRTVLGRFETATRYFEIMLPTRKKHLDRGKKSVLMSIVNHTGPDMIACVDADYDYVLQGATPQSESVIGNPYVFHTYVYAIENLQCLASTLHDVCVAVTLNDHRIFDFEQYLRQYSIAVFPLFVWSVWAYRTGRHNHFSMSDFNRVVDPGGFTVHNPQHSLSHLQRKVTTRIRQLEREWPEGSNAYLQTERELKALGITPETTYLYIQGHHLMDNVVVPIVSKVCNLLRQERQDEIVRTARHHTQKQNEMSCYEHSLQDIRQTLRKQNGYRDAAPFRRIQRDIQEYVKQL